MDFSQYQSPFSWRYGSTGMRTIWSEENKRRLWRQIWIALASAEAEFGLVTNDQIAELESHVDDIDITRALQIEAEIHHDLMAEVKTYAEQCPLAGGIIHLGATSMDIEDNADALRVRSSVQLIEEKLKSILIEFSKKMSQYADLPVMAFTHLQPAEPTTLGYRLAFYAQDLFSEYFKIKKSITEIKGKGFKGAVGNAASYIELFGFENYSLFEEKISQALDLPFYTIANQTYPRLQDYNILSQCAAIGSVLYKFAFDLRFLQSPPIGELAEPFGKSQVGSSAMPFKRNPIRSEKIDSLGRLLAQLPTVAWQDAAHSLLERTLDDSANRRSILPEAFLILDEMLTVSLGIIKDLQVNIDKIERNFAIYAPFAATERIMMAAAKNGADRQEIHELLRQNSLIAWEDVKKGKPNPLSNIISNNEIINKYLSQNEIKELTNVETYVGIAAHRAAHFAKDIMAQL
ncbi:MAG: adenylosuccinate lyase [Anaerolineaceae bacterium]|nr:adenylosuccinate lyase [Anaerolineaceae bacterium]